MKTTIATYKTVNRIIEEYNLFAKKNYGQNFIVEPRIVEKIADNSQITKDTIVIEIGPGIGALTEQLAQRAKEVLAYEIDQRLKPVLEDTLSDYSNISITYQDFLTVDIGEQLKPYKKEPIVMVANLPYYITTPILFKVFEEGTPINVITVMVQKEVGERFLGKVGSKDYNALTVIVQYLCTVKLVMKVSKHVFYPKPTIDSVVVQFTRKEALYDLTKQTSFFQFVKACFKYRRKTIANNLKEYLPDSYEFILEEAQIMSQRRPESISLEEYQKIFEVYYEM